jgi:hypothetical protein
VASRRREGSPAAMWGRARATRGTGVQLASPRVDGRWWRGRGEVRRGRTAAAGGGTHGGSGKGGKEARCWAIGKRASYGELEKLAGQLDGGERERSGLALSGGGHGGVELGVARGGREGGLSRRASTG